MECINKCGKEAISKGTKPAKYCSDRCRMQYKRTNGQSANEQSRANEQTNKQTDKGVTVELPANFGQADCDCFHCKQNRASGCKLVINHGERKQASRLASNEVNRVALPGDVDYKGCAMSTAST